MDTVLGALTTTHQCPRGQEDILARLWDRPFTTPCSESMKGSKYKYSQVVWLNGTFSGLCQALASVTWAYFLLAANSLESGSCSLSQALEFSQSTQSLGQEVFILRCHFLSLPTIPRALAARGVFIILSPSSDSWPLFAGHRDVRP